MEHDYSNLTIDEIQERLQWLVDRFRYCLACGRQPIPDDAIAEHYLLAELREREERAKMDEPINFFDE